MSTHPVFFTARTSFRRFPRTPPVRGRAAASLGERRRPRVYRTRSRTGKRTCEPRSTARSTTDDRENLSTRTARNTARSPIQSRTAAVHACFRNLGVGILLRGTTAKIRAPPTAASWHAFLSLLAHVHMHSGAVSGALLEILRASVDRTLEYQRRASGGWMVRRVGPPVSAFLSACPLFPPSLQWTKRGVASAKFFFGCSDLRAKKPAGLAAPARGTPARGEGEERRRKHSAFLFLSDAGPACVAALGAGGLSWHWIRARRVTASWGSAQAAALYGRSMFFGGERERQRRRRLPISSRMMARLDWEDGDKRTGLDARRQLV